MVSAVDGWAVGGSGVIVHWDGVAWSLVASPTHGEILWSVSMVSATDGWAVGGVYWGTLGNGTMLHWDGSDWWPVTSPTTDHLFAVSMTADNTGWAVGQKYHELPPLCEGGYEFDWWSSSLLRWDGTTWSQVADFRDSRLFHVAMVSAEEGWVSGEDFAIRHWTGNGWNPTTPGVPRGWGLNDVAMGSAVDGWAVGGNGDYGYSDSRMVRWDGMTWTQIDSPVGQGLNAVDLVSPDDGWAVGRQGVILHWDGQTWAQVTSPVTTTVLADVDMVSSVYGWAVGRNGVILHWDGVDWSQVDAQIQRDLYGVDMVSATDGWIVGEENTILHWDGQTWTAVTTRAGPRALIRFTTP